MAIKIITSDNIDDNLIIQNLRDHKVHVVGFAEAGLSVFRSLLEFAFDYSTNDAENICNRINNSDETGTIYPKGYLTGIPVRFFRAPLGDDNIHQFIKCLRDSFIANRDYCKCEHMVFDYRCGISNGRTIINESLRMAHDITDDTILKSVTLITDPTPLSDLNY